MASAKQAVDYRDALAKDYAHWYDVYENGCLDPLYADGVNLSFIKSHIEIDKLRIAENYATEDYPADYYRDAPPDVPADYMARAGEIRAMAQAALAVLESDESFLYLRSVRPALDTKTANKLHIDNVIHYVTGLRGYIAADRLVDMRRYRGIYSEYGYLNALRGCAERTWAEIEVNGGAEDGQGVQPSACTRPNMEEGLKMEYRFHLEKESRKPLVATIAEIIGVKAKYLAAPSYGYEIGGCTVDRYGAVTFTETFDAGQICVLLKGLAERGFEFEPFGCEEDNSGGNDCASVVYEDGATADADFQAEGGVAAEISAEGEAAKSTEPAIEPDITVVTETFEDDSYITISVPIDGFTSAAFANLTHLVTAKSWILKTMTGSEELPISRSKTRISFPWFTAGSDYKAVDAYSRLVTALCETAKKKRRVTSAERLPGDGENTRYKARCFLLSLGFIGGEYAHARKILLARFDGNGSHCSGDGKKRAVAINASGYGKSECEEGVS
ncbi:hypothetical protein FACS189490_03970 [Clostridia bacterium]|nr:hypothetical protein FACS189490_03970 [Clostridia bacterium]